MWVSSPLREKDQHYQDMLPVLHQVNVSLVNDEQLNRRQKVKISLLSFSTNDSPQTQGGGNEDVRGVEGSVEPDASLKYCHPCTNQPSARQFIRHCQPLASTRTKPPPPPVPSTSFPLAYNHTQIALTIKIRTIITSPCIYGPSAPTLHLSFTDKTLQKIVSTLQSSTHSSVHHKVASDSRDSAEVTLAKATNSMTRDCLLLWCTGSISDTPSWKYYHCTTLPSASIPDFAVVFCTQIALQRSLDLPVRSNLHKVSGKFIH